MLALIVHKCLWSTAKDQSPHLQSGESIPVPAVRICGDDLWNSPCESTWAPGRTSVQGMVISRECSKVTLPGKILLGSDPLLSLLVLLPLNSNSVGLCGVQQHK